MSRGVGSRNTAILKVSALEFYDTILFEEGETVDSYLLLFYLFSCILPNMSLSNK